MIFDSCHSGSGTRAPNRGLVPAPGTPDPGWVAREWKSVAPIHANIDLHLLAGKGPGAAKIALDELNRGLQSHVLLAGCGHAEKARELGQEGQFSRALFALLAQGVDLTYTELIDRLPPLVQYVSLLVSFLGYSTISLTHSQNPQCEGVNADRVIFDGLKTRPRILLYEIFKEKDVYIIRAGEIHGVAAGSEFSVYTSRTSTTSLGTVIATTVKQGPYRSQLETPKFTIPPGAVGRLVKYGIQNGLRLLVKGESNLPRIGKLLDPYDPALGVRVKDKDSQHPNLILDVTRDKVLVSVAQTLSITGPPTLETPFIQVASLAHNVFDRPLLSSCHRFFSNLFRVPPPPTKSYSSTVTMQVYKLEPFESKDVDEHGYLRRRPVGPDLIKDGVVDVVASDETYYGVTLSSMCLYGLYVSLWYFDTSDFTVSE